MRAIFIDSTLRNVRDVFVEKGLESMCEQLRCERVDCVSLIPGIDMWVDDEGMATKDRGFALVPREAGIEPSRFWGHGLVLAVDAQGETIGLPAHVTAEAFQNLVMGFWAARKDTVNVDR